LCTRRRRGPKDQAPAPAVRFRNRLIRDGRFAETRHPHEPRANDLGAVADQFRRDFSAFRMAPTIPGGGGRGGGSDEEMAWLVLGSSATCCLGLIERCSRMTQLDSRSQRAAHLIISRPPSISGAIVDNAYVRRAALPLSSSTWAPLAIPPPLFSRRAALPDLARAKRGFRQHVSGCAPLYAGLIEIAFRDARQHASLIELRGFSACRSEPASQHASQLKRGTLDRPSDQNAVTPDFGCGGYAWQSAWLALRANPPFTPPVTWTSMNPGTM